MIAISTNMFQMDWFNPQRRKPKKQSRRKNASTLDNHKPQKNKHQPKIDRNSEHKRRPTKNMSSHANASNGFCLVLATGRWCTVTLAVYCTIYISGTYIYIYLVRGITFPITFFLRTTENLEITFSDNHFFVTTYHIYLKQTKTSGSFERLIEQGGGFKHFFPFTPRFPIFDYFSKGVGSTTNHRRNAGTLGMVPLIINPIYTLHSGYLLGIFPFKGLLGGSNS